MASTSTNPLVNLKSSDGQILTLPKSAAVLSIAIKNVLEDSSGDDAILLPQVDGETLTKIITYLNEHDAVSDATSQEREKKFDEEFLSGKEMRELFEIVMAANFLNIKCLMDVVCQKIANTMKYKSVKWVRKAFNIANDFTPEEEEQIKNEHPWAWEDVEPDEDGWEDVEPDEDGDVQQDA